MALAALNVGQFGRVKSKSGARRIHTNIYILTYIHSQASMRTSEHVNCSFALLFHHHRRHDHEKSSLACPYFIYIKTYLRRFRVVIARGNVA